MNADYVIVQKEPQAVALREIEVLSDIYLGPYWFVWIVILDAMAQPNGVDLLLRFTPFECGMGLCHQSILRSPRGQPER